MDTVLHQLDIVALPRRGGGETRIPPERRRHLTAIREAADQRGVGVLLVEQHVRKALDVADRAYVMERGRIVLSGSAEQVAGQLDRIEDAYLAGAG